MALTSNLSKPAREVNPLLKMTYKELRKIVGERGKFYDAMAQEHGSLERVEEALGEESLVTLANKIIREGEKVSEEEKTDFSLLLAKAQSAVFLSRDLTERQKTIITNYVRKLKAAVLGIEVEVA